MDKRLKFMTAVMLLAFVTVGALMVKCMLFYDKDNISDLSQQYYKTVEYVYPRGNITDRSGISFNHSYSSVIDDILITNDDYPPVASQVIGKTHTDIYDTSSDGMKGLNGINMLFDELICGGDPVAVSAMADANGNVLKYLPATVTGEHINEGCDIALTLDYVLQKEYESVMREYAEKKGYESVAVTLTDCKSGEIIVMATYGSEMNMNVLSYQPGSIMKIISAAAALDEGIISPDDNFVCHGEFSVGEEKRHCSGKAVHGEIAMKEAFALSCNEWAYGINKLLCEEKDGIITSKALELAKDWGFCIYGNESHEFILDYSGHYSFVPEELYNDMDVFNSALGQGNIQASVYLINKITSAIANGGKIKMPYIVSTITDPAGNVLFDAQKEYDEFSLGLSSETVGNLQAFMRQTCISGSADFVKTENAAGKTGTAENISGEECHSWFTGYFTAGEKTFALTVFIPNGGNAPGSAVPLWDILAGKTVGFYVR